MKQSLIRTLLAITSISLLLCNCSRRTNHVVLQREWTANAEFAGDAWAAAISRDHGLQLDVREGSDTIDPVKMVRVQSAHFGVASADRVLRENEQGANLLILAAATYRSPVVFLSKPGLNIRSPSDFRGHTVGLQTGTNTELIFNALLRLQHISASEVKVVESGWGTQSFEVGLLDVLGAFAYDEPISLEMKRIQYTTVFPEDYGVHFVGTVYFTRKQLVHDNPQLVKAFVATLVDGWKRTMRDPESAIDILSRSFESVRTNLQKERRSLLKGLPYFSGEDGRPLYASRGRWQAMAAILISQGKLQAFDFDSNVDYGFLESALHQ
jgi:NitT/TauT family transport system substrate-binding protein